MTRQFAVTKLQGTRYEYAGTSQYIYLLPRHFNNLTEANDFMNRVYENIKNLIVDYIEMKGISSITNYDEQQIVEYVTSHFDKIASIPEIKSVLSGENLKVIGSQKK